MALILLKFRDFILLRRRFTLHGRVFKAQSIVSFPLYPFIPASASLSFRPLPEITRTIELFPSVLSTLPQLWWLDPFEFHSSLNVNLFFYSNLLLINWNIFKKFQILKPNSAFLITASENFRFALMFDKKLFDALHPPFWILGIPP